MGQLKGKKVCFFVKVDSIEYLNRVGFYKQDIQILKALGCEVKTVVRLRDIDFNSDFYYVWWWTWAFIPVLIGQIRRKPVIITGVFDHYVNGEIQDYKKRNFIHRLLIKYSLKYCTNNLFISHLENREISKYFGKVKSCVSRLAIDNTVFYNKKDNERQFGLLFTISWLTRANAKRKKLFEIIHSMPKVLERFPEARLVIAGKKNDAFEELTETVLSLKLNDHVIFTDAISEDEKIKYLQTCSVYLQPTEVEGFGLAILEAMACGTPVVSSNNGTVPEVMGDGGLYLENNTSDEISKAIIAILSDKDFANKLSVKAVLQAQKFSYDKRLEEMRHILCDLLKK